MTHMAQGNFTWHRGDITGDIYFDYLRPPGSEKIPFIRLYMMIDGNRDAKPVRGLRIMAYGTLAEILYGYMQKGSRIGVEGHVQVRERINSNSPAFEIVAEHVEFIRNIDYERGNQVMEELKARGKVLVDKSLSNVSVSNITEIEGNSVDVVHAE
jgi:hypothetical protein